MESMTRRLEPFRTAEARRPLSDDGRVRSDQGEKPRALFEPLTENRPQRRLGQCRASTPPRLQDAASVLRGFLRFRFGTQGPACRARAICPRR
jgi:hypothetical protein